MSSVRKPKKAILLPGNGTPPHITTLDGCGFYSAVQCILSEYGIPMPLPAFPDGYVGHEHIWKEFAVEALGLDADTLIIGHSTGSVCAMRLMEEHDVAGCVLVAAYHTDLGDEMERKSGYFSRPWDYEAMKKHAPWVLQFHSENDHLVPMSEAKEVAEKLGSEFVISPDDGHFCDDESEVLESALRRKLESLGLRR
jgi:predicted alpha/beta hydrolase family esterase